MSSHDLLAARAAYAALLSLELERRGIAVSDKDLNAYALHLIGYFNEDTHGYSDVLSAVHTLANEIDAAPMVRISEATPVVWASFIHKACTCRWEPAERPEDGRPGFRLTFRNATCIVHRKPRLSLTD